MSNFLTRKGCLVREGSDLNLGCFEMEESDPTLTPDLPVATFATTRWSQVLRAGAETSDESVTALGELYRTYSYPLYVYVRRQGHSLEVAEDIVQELFYALVEKRQLATVSPDRGRFRSYLLAAARHLLVNQWHRQHRQKRGFGELPVALDALSSEERFRLEPADEKTPERAYSRQWALALLDRVLARLERESIDRGDAESFLQLKPFLVGESADSNYTNIARRLNQREGAIRVAVHRLRQRYRQMIREEIALTVDDPGQIEEEWRNLVSALRD